MNDVLDTTRIRDLCGLVRELILRATAEAGSGHPTSSLSAVELMATLLFGGYFRYRVDEPDYPNNDRLIFSKGHASPLLYALWAAAGAISEEEMMSYRSFDSRLEGHPSVRFPYTEAATGSLGQGLSIGVGMALNAGVLDRLTYRTWVLLGDSEMAEGSQWEALQLADHYGLGNLVGVLDVNRLGQRGETMYGHDVEAYRKRVEAFGWRVVVVEDGHDLGQVAAAYDEICSRDDGPAMVIARTVKGKGAPTVEDSNGYHGKALTGEDLEQAMATVEPVNHLVRGEIAPPDPREPGTIEHLVAPDPDYELGDDVATRDAYGQALVNLGRHHTNLVSLDGEVSNSTRARAFRDAYPDRFFEMYIAEQNMVGAALGLALRGKLPFVSTFAAFLSRAHDQIRMAQYSEPRMVFVGSHAGVSIGQDGPSQMGLEDLAMFRSLLGSIVLYPADAPSCERLVALAAEHPGLSYVRTTRGATPVIYPTDEVFTVGGSKVLRSSDRDVATVVAAGICVHEALAAYDSLAPQGAPIRVIDAYSVKPLDRETLARAAGDTGAVITVEDHRPEGGLGEAVASVLVGSGVRFRSLAVRDKPRSGQPRELLEFEGIDREAIAAAVHELSA